MVSLLTEPIVKQLNLFSQINSLAILELITYQEILISLKNVTREHSWPFRNFCMQEFPSEGH